MNIALIVVGFVQIALQSALVFAALHICFLYRKQRLVWGPLTMSLAFFLMLFRRITATANVADHWESPLWLLIDAIILPTVISILLLAGFSLHSLHVLRHRRAYSEVREIAEGSK